MGLKDTITKINSFKYKIIFMLIFSLAINLGFIIYNSYLGIFFQDAFAIGISIYYLLLFVIRLITLLVEKKISNKDKDVQTKTRATNYKVSSIFVFIIDLCLIAPIILMVTQPHDFKLGLIPAITMATYCCYKVVVAIINYVKSKKSQNPTIILLKEMDIIGAIVSILNLQRALIMVNGGMNKNMQTLSLITSIGFILLIIAFSIVSFIRNNKLIKKQIK